MFCAVALVDEVDEVIFYINMYVIWMKREFNRRRKHKGQMKFGLFLSVRWDEIKPFKSFRRQFNVMTDAFLHVIDI